MAVYKEIAKADGSGVTTFYRLSDVHDTVEVDESESEAVVFDYNQAQNKPSINNIALVGNKTSEDLGLQPAGDYITNNEADAKFIDENELEAKNYVDEAQLQEALANIEHFHREIVAALPVTGDPNVLYLVRKQGSGEDIYNEYIWVGKTASETGYEFIGTTATDLTDYYQKEEVDDLLDGKVDKVNGKGLSEQNYTLVEKTKLAGLENYDDTEIQAKVSGLNTDVNNLKSSNTNISNTLAELKPDVESNTAAVSTIYDLLDNKMTAIRLVEQGDGWVWMNLEGSRLTYAQASAALGHENCMLFIEQLENDGKVIPAEYKSEGDHINVIFKDLDSLVHIMTCGEDDAVVTEDVTTINGYADFIVEDEAVGYTTKMTALYGNTTQNGTPTPDTPVPVNAVTGDNTIDIVGKNLFNSNLKQGARLFSNGDYFSANNYVHNENPIAIKEGETYTLSANNYSASSDAGFVFFNNGTFVSSLKQQSQTFTAPNGVNQVYCDFATGSDITPSDITNIQLEKGSTATTYEPYQEQTFQVNLGNIELCKIGDYQDRIYKDNGKWYLNKQIGKVVLDGSESGWVYDSEFKYFSCPTYKIFDFSSNIPLDMTSANKNTYNQFCNLFTINKNWSGPGSFRDSTTTQGIFYPAQATGDRLLFRNTDFTTTIDFSNWLSSNNTLIYYPLATPTITEITDSTLLAQLNALEQITQYKHTYITISGLDLTPEADFTYIDNVVINNTDLVLGKDTYWNDEVPTQQDLPSNAQEGEIRIVQDTEDVYIYNGTKWVPFNKGGAGVIPVATATTLGGVKVGEYLTVTEDGVLSFDKQELDYIYNDIDKKAAKTDLDAIYTSLDNKVEYQSHVDTEADLPLIVDWDAVDEETPELVLDIQDNFNEIRTNKNNLFSRGGNIKRMLNSITKRWIPNSIGEDYKYWLGTSYSLSNGGNLWGLYVFNNYERSGGKQSTTVFLGKVTAPNNTEVVLPFYYITATAKRHEKVRFYNFRQSVPEYVNAWKIVHADGSIENITFTSGSLDKELTTDSLIFPDLANSGATALNYVDFMKFNLGSSSSTGYMSEGYYAIGSPQSRLSFYQWSHSTLNNFRLAVEEVYPGIVGYNALHLEEFDDTYEGELHHYTIADTPLLIINTDNRMEYGFLNAGIKTGNLYSVGADNELFYIDSTYKYQHWAQGGGGGGTSDYSALSNKPQINGTTLTGNKTGSDLGLVSSADVLTKTNTTSYTPSGDYQPATKKYVDDLIPTQTILTDTLTAGNTTLTFTDSSILTSSLIDVYTDTFGVNPTNMTSSTGELILTFPVQTDDVDVKVVIR